VTEEEERDGYDPSIGVFLKGYGNPELKMPKATTLSLGFVLNPQGTGPRLSVDYSKVKRTGDPRWLNPQQVLLHEDMWPERVVREPLTEEDRAQGYTGGIIKLLDYSAINGNTRVAKNVDTRLRWPLPLLGGTLVVSANATVQLSNVLKELIGRRLELLDYRTGPLKFRANGGVEWEKGPWSFGLSMQHFGKYKFALPHRHPLENEFDARMQGGARVPSQTFFDVRAARSLRLAERRFDLELGVVNLLDTSPALLAAFGPTRSFGPSYSRYGDPRRRRFELVISSGL
jgi:hypothetical protein